MSAALTGGAFTRTQSERALHRERAGIRHVLDTIDALAIDGVPTPVVADLRSCAEVCDSEADLTALRVLAQHAKLHAGTLVSAPLRAKLARLVDNCFVQFTPPST